MSAAGGLAAVFIAAYLALLASFALRARRRTRTLEDYFTGGRRFGGVLVGLSFFATYVSTNTFIGMAGRSYRVGATWLGLGAVLFVLATLSWLVLARRFRDTAAALGSLGPADFFRLRYASPGAGRLAAAVILFDSVFYLAAVFLGSAEAASRLTGLSFGPALLAVFAVQVGYTFVGGYVADVWTDAVQSVLMLAAAVALPLALLARAGGWDAAWSSLEAQEPSLAGFSTGVFVSAVLGFGLAGGLKFASDPRQLSRFYGLAGGRAAWVGMLVAPLAIGLSYLFLLPVGLLARLEPLPPAVARNTDAIVPYLIGDAQVLGAVGGSLLLVTLVAAAMSSVDSVLLVAGAALQRELLPGRGDSGDLATARRLVVAYAFLPLGVAALARAGVVREGIVELTAFSGAIYAGAFLPAIVGALWWRRASAAGAIAGLLAGCLAPAAWRYGVLRLAPGLAPVHEVYVGLLAGTVAFVVASWRTGARADRAG